MALAKSTVQVSIVSQLGQGFSAAFQTANSRMVGLRKAVTDTSKAMGNIEAFRKQQEAAKAAGYSWQAAKIKADQFRAAITAQGAPTKKQTQELAKLEVAAGRAGDKFGQQRSKLAEMGRELQRAGVHTGRLAQEYDRLKAKLQSTEAQHVKMERSLQRQQRIVSAMGGTWRGIATATAGVTAAGAVLAGPTRKAMTYDEQLSYMADTATGGDGQEAYQRNKAQISDGIDAALKGGGGKREDAAAALNTMVASGKFTMPEALAQLKAVVKTAFASGASSDDIAKTAISMKNFGLTDLSPAFDMMMRAGQMGGFELKDMAKSLPSQLAYARASGYVGMGDLAKLLSLNQAAMSTAGTTEEAGNNVINLLQKFSSRELQDRLAKELTPREGDPTAPNKKNPAAFDWSSYLMQQREKGVDPARAMTMLLDREMKADKRYDELQKKASASGDKSQEKKDALEGMTNILMGSKMGEFFTDRQAALGALAAVYQADYMASIEKGARESVGTTEKSSANIRGETWAKAVDTANAVNRANEQAYNSLSGPLGKVLEFTSGLANEYPRLTTAVYGATTAITALAAAAGAMGLAGKILGRGGAGAAAASTAATATAASGAAATGTGMLATVAKLAGPAAAAVGIANMTNKDEDAVIDKMASSERAKKAELTQRYGRDTLDKAYQTQSPWYQFGGVDNARPEHIEKWVKSYLATQTGSAVAAPQNGVAATQAPVQSPLAEKVLESSTAAADAAKAASEAATAAQNRPNVVQNNTYAVTVQATQQDPLAITNALDKALRDREREKDATLRSNFLNQPNY